MAARCSAVSERQNAVCARGIGDGGETGGECFRRVVVARRIRGRRFCDGHRALGGVLRGGACKFAGRHANEALGFGEGAHGIDQATVGGFAEREWSGETRLLLRGQKSDDCGETAFE